jgi:hypothetical protein
MMVPIVPANAIVPMRGVVSWPPTASALVVMVISRLPAKSLVPDGQRKKPDYKTSAKAPVIAGTSGVRSNTMERLHFSESPYLIALLGRRLD